MMTEQELIHEAYIKALAAVKRANQKGHQYIGLAPRRDSYRLTATYRGWMGETVYRFDMLPADWAKNVVYRLGECCLLSAGADSIDEYFDGLEGKHGP